MSEMLRMKVYGAWLFSGVWDGRTPPPGEGWKIIAVKPGRYNNPPKGMAPRAGQVLLLMQGDGCLVVSPE